MNKEANFCKCPACGELLVFPRVGTKYCEDCGWGDETEIEGYHYFSVGSNLEGIKGLEFFDGEKWVKSGLLFGSHIESLRGRYRTLIGNLENK